jgi:glycine/D-amino acid oxidase-like deaminating enzyme
MKISSETSPVDIAIVGGGIIGLACADALSRLNMRVCVIERLGLASGASSSCQGGIGLEVFMEEYDLKMHLAGIAEYRKLAEEGIEVGYHQDGGLVAAVMEEKTKYIPRLEQLQAMGIQCEWLEGDALKMVEPSLSSEVECAIFLADFSQIYPIQVVMALAKRAYQQGVQIFTNTELTGIEMKHGKVTAALTSVGRIVTEKIIIAAGSWSSEVGRLVNLKIPVWPLKGHILVTEPAPRLIKHFLTETGYESGANIMRSVELDLDNPRPVSPQVAPVLQNLPRGEILIGSSREFAGFNHEVDRERIRAISRRAHRLIPDLAKLRIIRTYTGFRPWTPDGHPIIGATKQADGIILATGHAGEGNTLAILTGHLVADLVTGRVPSLDPSPLLPDRFDMSL